MQNTPDPIPLTETEIWYANRMVSKTSLKIAKVLMLFFFGSIVMLGISALHNVVSGNATQTFEVVMLFFTTPLAFVSAFLMVNILMTRQTILPDKHFITGKFKLVIDDYFIDDKLLSIPQDMDIAFTQLENTNVEAWCAVICSTNIFQDRPQSSYYLALNFEDVIDIDNAFHDPLYQEAFIVYSRVYQLGVILGGLLLCGVIAVLVELNIPEAFIITSILITILIVGSLMVYLIMVVLPKTYGISYDEILKGHICRDDELDNEDH